MHVTRLAGLAFVLADAEQTESLGRALSQGLKPESIVFLQGDLGAGKTTLVRGLLRGFGFSGSTKSPTYTLVEPYKLAERMIYHFDLYRLGDPEELEYIGLDDYFNEPGSISVIEWPEKGQGWLPSAHIHIELSYDGVGRRAVVTSSDQEVLDKLAKFQ